MTRLHFPGRKGVPAAKGYRSRLDMDVDGLLSLLGEGPQDRHALALRMAATDRRMRHAVEEARRRGELVIWVGGLYRLAQSAGEFETWAIREQRSRLGTLHAQLSAMTRTAQRRWPAEQARLPWAVGA